MFTQDDVIHTYTRAEAIEDGVLIDVSETAREAGFKFPVAITAGVQALIEDIPPSRQYQDVEGRLWDVLYMAVWKAKSAAEESEGLFSLIMHHGRKTYATLKLHVGPGDNGEGVVTISLPNED